MATKNLEKALEAVQLDINKEYGEGSIMRLGGRASLDVEAISTGCLHETFDLMENIFLL